jgi:hypothetical protein
MHIDSIDFLKGLAIIGVITLHSFRDYGIFEILVLQAVPIFIILMGLNGALSLKCSGFNVQNYVRKKAMRLILPLIPVFFIVISFAFLFHQPIYTLGSDSLSHCIFSWDRCQSMARGTIMWDCYFNQQ